MEEKTFRSRFEAWLVNGGSRYILYGVWFFVQALIFTFAFINYKVSDNFKTVRGLFGTPLFYARASALNLHVSNGIILLPVCRNLISWMRTTPLNKVIPFDENIAFHKLVGWTIVFFTAVHVFAHVINYMTLAAVTNSSWFVLWFTNGPGWTGNLMTLALALIAGLAIKRVRTQKFEMFWYTHHLFIVYFALFSFHGTWCLVQPDREPKCSNAGAFWKYWLVSGLIYISERAIRELRGRRKTYITKVVLHPSQVVEVQIRKDGIQAKAGQYVFLNCPEVSLYQWHPFTLTSAPEEDYLSCHIRVVGDFTKDFARKLGCDVESKQPKAAAAGEINRLLPRLLIDGPFGSASEDVFNYEVAVLVGAGIGVTPFASVLKSIWYRSNYPNKATKLRKAYFFWICRDYQAFEWFQDLLKAIEDQDIENFLEIHVYLTGRLKPDELKNVMLNDEEGEEDALTGLKAPTHYGRPNLDQIFPAFKKAHPDTEVGVFFCGPKPLSKSLHTACIKYSDTWEGGTKFNYNKENF